MRQLLLLVLMCAGTSLVARDLFVVVHTTDAVVDRFVRTRGSNTVENGATERTVVRRAGSVDWHAVGGRAPYTVINHARSADGTVCVTVIDADGAVATGCGVMQVQTQVVVIPCAADDATPVPEAISRSSHQEQRALLHEERNFMNTQRHPVRERPVTRSATDTDRTGTTGVQRERTPARTTTPGGGTPARNPGTAPVRRY